MTTPRRSYLYVLIPVIALGLGALAYFWRPSAVPPASGAKNPEGGTKPTRHDYVGDSTCAPCHAAALRDWRGSNHDLAMQVASRQAVLAPFGGEAFDYAGMRSNFYQKDGKFYVTTDGPDGKLHDFEVKYTFGVRPLQQYLLELPGGRLQALGIAWDSRAASAGGQRWFHLYPGQSLKAGDPLHWTAASQNWNFQCAECHSTNFRKNYQAQTHSFNSQWSALNVSCEACHGPASAHVQWAQMPATNRAADASRGLSITFDERHGVTWAPQPDTGTARRNQPRLSSKEIDMCARCHGRSSKFSDDYQHGASLLDTHRLALLEDGLYWPDGQMRDEVYNWGSFTQSRMHAQGVTCSDCHNPHTLKLRVPVNDICTTCHQAARFATPAHTHHRDASPGAQCATCHMPVSTYMVIDRRHDHSLRLPRPDLSRRLGVPNACNSCHKDRSPEWAEAALARWAQGKPGPTPKPGFQTFADTFAAATRGDPRARDGLLQLAGDRAQPAVVRGSALARLKDLGPDGWEPRLTPLLADPDAVVRLAAVELLAVHARGAAAVAALAALLKDPVRAVRMEAAQALAGPGEADLSSDLRPAFTAALEEYTAAQEHNADRPESHVNLGNLAAQRGDAAAATAHYRTAMAVDPGFAPAYVNLADLQNTLGQHQDAEASLRQGLQHLPNTAVLHHALGLTYARQKNLRAAGEELGAAVKLDPNNSRYVYVYALSLAELGQRAEARRVVRDALQRLPADPALLELQSQLK